MRRAWLVLVLALAGCGGTSRFYALQYELDAHALNADPVPFPPKAARQLLANARTVAFAPPDHCLDASRSNDVSMVGSNCGSIMAALEQQAADAGFEVVSWQALRGNQPAVVYAKRQKVDVLFEVNRIDLSPEGASVGGAGRMQFFEADEDGQLGSPVSVGQSTQHRCRNFVESQIGNDGLYIDVKMVSVRDGRTLWNYHWWYSRSEVRGGRPYYFRDRVKKSTWWTVGAVMAGIGGAAVISGASIPEKNTLSSGLLVGGAGVVLMLTTGSSRPSADRAVCRATVEPPGLARAAPAPETGGEASDVSFTFARSGAQAELERDLRQLAEWATDDFIRIVALLRANENGTTPPKPKARRAQRRAAATRKDCLYAREQHEAGLMSEASVRAACSD